MGKKITVLLLLLCGAPLLRAQETKVEVEESSWVLRMVRKGYTLMTRPNPNLEADYIYQMPLQWSFAVDFTQRSFLADLQTDVQRSSVQGDVSNYALQYHLGNPRFQKVGVSVGFAGLSLGYGREISPRSSQRNTYFSLGTAGTYYGAQIQRYIISEYIRGSLSGDGLSAPMDLVSDYPGMARYFSVDGFYAFNKRRFSYSSALNGKKLQRQSAGSWMIAARYMQGDLTVNGQDSWLISLTQGLTRHSTDQFSFGGGYSFNWVFLHRDPVDPSGVKGLRNLTLNLTADPMVSFYNHVTSINDLARTGQERTSFDGRLALAVQTHAALGFSWDRFCLSAQLSHNRFGFDSAAQTIWSETQEGRKRNEVETGARFRDLTGKIQLFARF